MRRIPTLICSIAMATIVGPAALAQTFDLPPLPAAWQYGDVMITRQETGNDQLPVVFSHWSHRTQYTCRVCHFELGFAMQANTTEITEQDNKNGQYCGVCHNGDISFGHTEENCEKCHSGGWKGSSQRFKKLKHLPTAPFGNRIDWTLALESGLINPKQSILEENYVPMEFERELDIDANWNLIPPASFPHDKHKLWLDCGDCHPAIFNVKKKTTEYFEMRYILEGKFCGACHLKVAFPLNDCTRCHPKMHR